MRLNPERTWVRKDVPDLRIISDEFWASAKARQIELVDIYAASKAKQSALQETLAKAPADVPDLHLRG